MFNAAAATGGTGPKATLFNFQAPLQNLGKKKKAPRARKAKRGDGTQPLLPGVEEARARRAQLQPHQMQQRQNALVLALQRERRDRATRESPFMAFTKPKQLTSHTQKTFLNADTFMESLKTQKEEAQKRVEKMTCESAISEGDEPGNADGRATKDVVGDGEPARTGSAPQGAERKKASKGRGSKKKSKYAISATSFGGTEKPTPGRFTTSIRRRANHLSMSDLTSADSTAKSDETPAPGHIQAALKMSYKCKDMAGRSHDVKELRKKRMKAVNKGIKYMHKFLRKKKYKNLLEIGDDAPSIFFEMWYTSADSRVRTTCRSIAIELLEVLERRILAKPANDRDDFFEAMFLLRIKHEMDLPHEELLKRADKIFDEQNFSDTDKLFDVPLDGLDYVKTQPWLLLLMRILIMEYNNLIFSKRFPLEWGLKHAFLAIRRHELQGPPAGGNFHDSFFLATHICYALSAYCATKTSEREVKWLWRYLRKSLKYWMGEARLRDKEHRVAEEERKVAQYRYVDIDGVAEVVDVLRGCGLTPAGDTMLCEATVWLLKTQEKSGSWPLWFDHGTGKDDKDTTPYDFLHPTWVATQALRDRDFKLQRRGNQKWDDWVHKLIKETDFGTLEYEAKWNERRKKKKKNDALGSRLLKK